MSDDVTQAIDEIRIALRSLTETQRSPTDPIAGRIDAIENRLADHEARLTRAQEDALIATWSDFEEDEKWKVWWGVAWRGAGVYALAGALVAFLIQASN